MPGYRWNGKKKDWEYPTRPETLGQLKRLFPKASIHPKVIQMVWEVETREDLAEQIKSMEKVEPIEPMPIKTKPFLYQIKALNVGIQLLY